MWYGIHQRKYICKGCTCSRRKIFCSIYIVEFYCWIASVRACVCVAHAIVAIVVWAYSIWCFNNDDGKWHQCTGQAYEWIEKNWIIVSISIINKSYSNINYSHVFFFSQDQSLLRNGFISYNTQMEFISFLFCLNARLYFFYPLYTHDSKQYNLFIYSCFYIINSLFCARMTF